MRREIGQPGRTAIETTSAAWSKPTSTKNLPAGASNRAIRGAKTR